MFTPIQGALPKNERRLRERQLILVDIENVLGTPTFTADDALLARDMIENSVGSIRNELVMVVSSHRGMFQVFAAWHGARLKFQSGPDGADLALLEELQHADIAERFTDVILVSGDGIFTDRVVSLTAQGVKVTVVAPVDGCSRRLELAANKVMKFDRSDYIEGGAA